MLRYYKTFHVIFFYYVKISWTEVKQIWTLRPKHEYICKSLWLCHALLGIFTESVHWADSVYKLQSPSVCVSVCLQPVNPHNSPYWRGMETSSRRGSSVNPKLSFDRKKRGWILFLENHATSPAQQVFFGHQKKLDCIKKNSSSNYKITQPHQTKKKFSKNQILTKKNTICCVCILASVLVSALVENSVSPVCRIFVSRVGQAIKFKMIDKEWSLLYLGHIKW